MLRKVSVSKDGEFEAFLTMDGKAYLRVNDESVMLDKELSTFLLTGISTGHDRYIPMPGYVVKLDSEGLSIGLSTAHLSVVDMELLLKTLKAVDE